MFPFITTIFARSKKSKPCKQTTTTFFLSECESIVQHSQNSYKTNENSLTAIRSFRQYLGKDDIPLKDVNAKLIQGYEAWLMQRGVRLNTSAEYMRSLRALFNKIVGRRSRRHPFDGVTTTIQSTRKRAISLETMRSVASFHTKDQQLQLSLDMFLFSFYCMGMPFVDIARLRPEQIDGDTLTYHRRKTGVEVVMHLEPEAREIIKRYQKDGNRYVFPLLNDGSDKDYRRALALHNKRLRMIEKAIALQVHISSYVSRHTWATHAYSESGDIGLVANAIGHANTAVTKTYIKPLPDGKTAMVNKIILGRIKEIPIRDRCSLFMKSLYKDTQNQLNSKI